MKQVALFGGSFDPPGLHHKEIAYYLSSHFHEVIVIPCGLRPDKESVNKINPSHRAVMTAMTFCEIPKVVVDTFDVHSDSYTTAVQLQNRYVCRGELWHVVGSDLIFNGNEGKSLIHTTWKEGEYVWEHFRFLIIPRHEFPFRMADLPPNHFVANFDSTGSSSEIRVKVKNGEPITGLVAPEVEQYITQNKLYL